MVEDISPGKEAEIIYTSNRFNDFDENVLLKDFKPFQKKKAIAILSEIKKQPDQLTFDKNGTIFIEGNNIPNSNISVYLKALFSGKTKDIDGFQDFINKLQKIGLSRFIPKKCLPKYKFDPSKSVEKNPFSMEKWYFIGE